MARLSPQPLHRLRLLRGGHRRRPRRSPKQRPTNARFEVKDAATLDDVERYDLITAFDAIHDQAKPDDVLKASRGRSPTGPS